MTVKSITVLLKELHQIKQRNRKNLSITSLKLYLVNDLKPLNGFFNVFTLRGGHSALILLTTKFQKIFSHQILEKPVPYSTQIAFNFSKHLKVN